LGELLPRGWLVGVLSFGMSYLGATVGMVLTQPRVALLTYVRDSEAPP
jgi:hypothetical protein